MIFMFKYTPLSIFLILLSIDVSHCGCFKLKQLTTPSTQHSAQVSILKMTSDSKIVFSVGQLGDIKVWDLIGNDLYLKQYWNLVDNFPTYGFKNSLYVWRDGQKLFVGGKSGVVKIYTLNKETQLYDLVNVKTVNTRLSPLQDNQWITSIYVNNLGNQMFVGVFQNGEGISRFLNNGEQWIRNNPQSIMKQIGNQHKFIDFIQMTSDQKKLMFVTYNLANKTLLIFYVDGQNYTLSQRIIMATNFHSGNTCRLSNDDSIISCFGSNLQFGTYMFDKSTNKYVNISVPNTRQPVTFEDVFMDSKNYLTAACSSDSTIYKYKFQQLNGVSTFTEVDKIKLPQIYYSRLTTIVSQPQSKFHIVGAWYQQKTGGYKFGGKIFFVSCYQSLNVDE